MEEIRKYVKKILRESVFQEDNLNSLIAYHGSRSVIPFQKFDNNMIGSGLVSIGNKSYDGFFFTTEEENAEYYTEYFVAKVRINGIENYKIENKHPSKVLSKAKEDKKIYIIEDILDGAVFSDIIVVPSNRLESIEILEWNFVGDEEFLFERYDEIFGGNIKDTDDEDNYDDDGNFMERFITTDMIDDILDIIGIDLNFLLKIPVFKKYYDSKGDLMNEERIILKDRLMHVDDDVDFLYNKYFKNDVDEIKITGTLTRNMFQKYNLDTNELISPLSKKANNLNPCVILVNSGNNYYNPKSKIISISINNQAVDYCIANFNGNLELAKNYLNDKYLSSNFENEFTEQKIKGSIHHELAHWIDDTLHNKHIFNRIEKANERGVSLNKKGLPINADKMELQAQIHNIHQIKRNYFDSWDYLTFDNLLLISPTLNSVNNELRGDVKKRWKINLLKRMHREGLLGKNMISERY